MGCASWPGSSPAPICDDKLPGPGLRRKTAQGTRLASRSLRPGWLPFPTLPRPTLRRNHRALLYHKAAPKTMVFMTLYSPSLASTMGIGPWTTGAAE